LIITTQVEKQCTQAFNPSKTVKNIIWLINLQLIFYSNNIKLEKKKEEYILSLRNGFRIFKIGLGTHLFVKVPRPGDSEGTLSVFESNCHLLLSVYPYS